MPRRTTFAWSSRHSAHEKQQPQREQRHILRHTVRALTGDVFLDSSERSAANWEVQCVVDSMCAQMEFTVLTESLEASWALSGNSKFPQLQGLQTEREGTVSHDKVAVCRCRPTYHCRPMQNWGSGLCLPPPRSCGVLLGSSMLTVFCSIWVSGC